MMRICGNQSIGSTERRAISSQFFSLRCFCKGANLWNLISYQTGSGKMVFAADRQVLLVLVITAEFLNVFCVFYFCKAPIFTERTKPRGGWRDFVTKEIVSLFSCGDTVLLFLPPCKWINFLRLICLMFSISHRRILQNLFYHEIFISTFWIPVLKLSSHWFCKR